MKTVTITEEQAAKAGFKMGSTALKRFLEKAGFNMSTTIHRLEDWRGVTFTQHEETPSGTP